MPPADRFPHARGGVDQNFVVLVQQLVSCGLDQGWQVFVCRFHLLFKFLDS